MKYLLLLTVVMLGGCATSVPITAQFPAPPGKMAIERCPNLKKLNELGNYAYKDTYGIEIGEIQQKARQLAEGLN